MSIGELSGIDDTLRSAQLDMTRRRIARAVLESIVEHGADAVSFPMVAERASVSLRTVYRYFPNKDVLLASAMSAGSERANAAMPREERTVATMGAYIPHLWRELLENIDLVRLQHTTTAGSEVRAARLRGRVEEVSSTLARDEPGIAEADRELLAALITTLVGSSMLIDLVQHIGIPVDEAGRLSAFTITAVVDAARANGVIPR